MCEPDQKQLHLGRGSSVNLPHAPYLRVHVTHEILDTGKLESLLGIYSYHKIELDLLPLAVSIQGESKT